MLKNHFDIFIIGQGLAGSLLAYHCLKLGLRVCVIDHDYHQSASTVAAGIINPLHGPRLSETPDYLRYFNYAKNCFTQLETLLNVSLWQTQTQTRLLKKTSAITKAQQLEQQYPWVTLATSSAFSDTEHIVAKLNYSATIDCAEFIQSMKQWLSKKGAYLNQKIDYTQLYQKQNAWHIDQLSAKRIVFCEGHQVTNNPWLQQLPLQFSQGDILHLSSKNDSAFFQHFGYWFVKNAWQNFAKLGASYLWSPLDHRPNIIEREKLLLALHQHTDKNHTVIQHHVGIRANTQDKHPVIGTLTQQKNGYCFNGFGSKGCLLIPYYAQQFSKKIAQNIALKISPKLYLKPQQQRPLDQCA